MSTSSVPLRIALVGCGRIARHHANAIATSHALAELVAVVDAEESRARQIAAEHGHPVVLAAFEQALMRPDIDAVILCTPNALHAAQSIQALAAGRHVLVEKPMAESVADAERMAETAARAGRVLALGQTMRHTAPVRWLQDHLRDFGALRAIEVSMCVHWDGPQASWWSARTPEQGLILSLFAPHALDFVQLAMGGEQPLQVHAEVARFQQGWLGEDEAMILLRYPGGCLAQVHLSYNQRFFVDRRTLHCADAMLRIENGARLWVDDRLVVEPAPPRGGAESSDDEHGGVFRVQLEEFVRAVRGEPHRSVLPAEGVQLTRLLQRTIASGLANAPRG